MSTNLDECQSITTRAGGIWDYVSPSRLGLWLRCSLAFRFRYIDGIEVPTSPSLFLGKMVHLGLRWYYEARQAGTGVETAELCRRLACHWEQAVEEEGLCPRSAGESEALKRQAAGLLAAYVEQVPADEPPSLAVEMPMEAPLVDPATGVDLGMPLLGITDLVLRTAEGPVVIDFKTSARAAAPLEITHEIQLTSCRERSSRLIPPRRSDSNPEKAHQKTPPPRCRKAARGRGTGLFLLAIRARMRSVLHGAAVGSGRRAGVAMGEGEAELAAFGRVCHAPRSERGLTYRSNDW